MSLRELLQHGTRILSKTQSATPSLDASLLLGFTLGLSREDMLINRDNEIQSGQIKVYEELLLRRCTGEPVAYIVGKKSFWHYDFYVSSDVLIPKPDTELLVEKALIDIEFFLKERTDMETLRIADICTGSGCIAISLLAHFSEMPQRVQSLQFVATDISTKALDIAKKNAKTILSSSLQEKLHFAYGDLLNIPEFEEGDLLDLIVSNPPYVPSNITKDLLLDGRKEPVLALDGGIDGLDVIYRLIPQAFAKLKEGGVLLLETGEYNARQTREALMSLGFKEVETYNDLSGQPRVTRGVKEILH